MSYLDDVRRAALDRCPGLLMEWMPGGSIVGHTYQCGDLHGGRGDSLKVTLAGRGAGLWKDWASGEPGGDLIGLYARLHFTNDRDGYKRALQELADKFGVEKPKREPPQDWQTVFPVPESAYSCDALGNPVLPLIKFRDSVPVKSWAYLDAEGQLLQFRCRFEPASLGKAVPLSFARNKKDGRTEWRWQDLPRPRPLYNLIGISCAPAKILIVEGESCAVSAQCRMPGWCVVTWPGGCKNVQNCDWAPLVGFKGRVVLWPDCDDEGCRAMTDVSAILNREVDVVAHDPSWPKGHDIADLDWTTEQIEAWIEKSVVHSVQPKPKVRPVVELKGQDHYWHMREFYRSVREASLELYYTANGPAEVKVNIYGRIELRYLNKPELLAAWAAEHLEVKKHISNELRWISLEEKLAQAVIFHGQEHLPHLLYTSHTPVVTQGGETIEKSGYNAASKIYVALPEDYSGQRSEADSIDLIKDVLCNFPFEKETDRTHAVAFVLTCILRHSFDGPTPLFRFEAPTPGTGKTLLCQILSEIVTPNAQYLPAPSDNEELKKLLTAALLKQPQVISFDNVEKLEFAAIKQALTTGWWEERVLGETRTLNMPIRSVWAATINNPQMSREMLRRTVRVRLNAQMESPEMRDPAAFRHPDLLSYVRLARPALLSAFTCLAGHANANGNEMPRLGGYEGWIRAVYPALSAAGCKDFLGSYKEDSQSAVDSADTAISDFVSSWGEKFGSQQVYLEDLLRVAAEISGLPIKRNREGFLSPESLGRFISKIRGRIIDGYLVKPPSHSRSGNCYELFDTDKTRSHGSENQQSSF